MNDSPTITDAENVAVPPPPAPSPSAPALGDIDAGNGRTGAPYDNRNAYRHGLKSRQGPETDSETTTIINVFRRATEDAVVAMHGKISPACALMIYSAMQSLRFSVDEQRDIETCGSKWTPDQRTAKRNSVAKLLDNVNGYLRKLGLSTPGPDAGDFKPADLYAEPLPTALEKPPRFSDTSKPLHPNLATEVPQNNAEKPTDDFTVAAVPAVTEAA